MNRTILAIVALAVVIALAGFLFYDGSANDGDTVVDKADQTTSPPAAPATPAAP